MPHHFFIALLLCAIALPAQAHEQTVPWPSLTAIFEALGQALSGEPAAEPRKATPRARKQAARVSRPSAGTVRASWYGGGEKLNRHTANGEVFRPSALTCAHRKLPFGSRVQVINHANGKSVVCRVNDRGPHHSTGKAIDLSRAAADRIGMRRAGTATVTIKVLSR